MAVEEAAGSKSVMADGGLAAGEAGIPPAHLQRTCKKLRLAGERGPPLTIQGAVSGGAVPPTGSQLHALNCEKLGKEE